jgi:hypothetical protein
MWGQAHVSATVYLTAQMRIWTRFKQHNRSVPHGKWNNTPPPPNHTHILPDAWIKCYLKVRRHKEASLVPFFYNYQCFIRFAHRPSEIWHLPECLWRTATWAYSGWLPGSNKNLPMLLPWSPAPAKKAKKGGLHAHKIGGNFPAGKKITTSAYCVTRRFTVTTVKESRAWHI